MGINVPLSFPEICLLHSFFGCEPEDVNNKINYKKRFNSKLSYTHSSEYSTVILVGSVCPHFLHNNKLHFSIPYGMMHGSRMWGGAGSRSVIWEYHLWLSAETAT